jgi:hypothetical protein
MRLPARPLNDVVQNITVQIRGCALTAPLKHDMQPYASNLAQGPRGDKSDVSHRPSGRCTLRVDLQPYAQ